MSRLEERFVLTAGSAPDLNVLIDVLSAIAFDVERRDDVVIARQGSQLMTRLLGAWSVAYRRLPKELVAKITPENELEICLRETLGVGVFDRRTRERYQHSFREIEEKLRARLEALWQPQRHAGFTRQSAACRLRSGRDATGAAAGQNHAFNRPGYTGQSPSANGSGAVMPS